MHTNTYLLNTQLVQGHHKKCRFLSVKWYSTVIRRVHRETILTKRSQMRIVKEDWRIKVFRL